MVPPPRPKKYQLPCAAERWKWMPSVFVVAVAWIFQGQFYASRTERLFRLTLEALLLVALAVPLTLVLQLPFALLLALILSHAGMFLLYGHFMAIWRHLGPTPYPASHMLSYTNDLKKRICREPSIVGAGLWGSFAREEPSAYPDLDVKLFRRPGLWQGVRACTFLLRERLRALIIGFPLDAALWENLGQMRPLREDEVPLVLCDMHSILRKTYPHARSLDDFVRGLQGEAECSE